MDPISKSIRPTNNNATPAAASSPTMEEALTMKEVHKEIEKQVLSGTMDEGAGIATQQVSTKDITPYLEIREKENKSKHRTLRFLSASRPPTLNGDITTEDRAVQAYDRSSNSNMYDASTRTQEFIHETTGAQAGGLNYDNAGRLQMTKGELPLGADYPGAYAGAPGSSYRLASPAPAPARPNTFSMTDNAIVNESCNYLETLEMPMDMREIYGGVPMDTRWQTNGERNQTGLLDEAGLATVTADSPQPQRISSEEHGDEEQTIMISGDRADSRPLLEATLVEQESTNPVRAPQLAEVVELAAEPKLPLCTTGTKWLCFGIAVLATIAGVASVAIYCAGGNCNAATADATDPGIPSVSVAPVAVTPAPSVAPVAVTLAPTAAESITKTAVNIFGDDLFTNRTRLDLGSVEFGGPVPTEMGFMTALKHLDLSQKSLTGTIPTWLGLMTAMTYLSLHTNDLTGIIPTELGLLSSTLNILYLHQNSLSGPISTELGLMTKLISLAPYNNMLTGTIPTELGLLTASTFLRLSGNEMVGSIPTELALLTKLTTLGLFTSSITGTIPTELGLLSTKLDSLFLNDALLSGTVPRAVCQLTQYQLTLHIDCNRVICPSINCTCRCY